MKRLRFFLWILFFVGALIVGFIVSNGCSVPTYKAFIEQPNRKVVSLRQHGNEHGSKPSSVSFGIDGTIGPQNENFGESVSGTETDLGGH